jgi:tRNA-dependent cyclodipeptide synthase
MSTVTGHARSDERSPGGSPLWAGLSFGFLGDSCLGRKDTSMGSARDERGESYSITAEPLDTHGRLADRFLAGERLPCFLGLSPTTSFVNRARLEAILRWLAPRSQDVMIVEGTYSSRWNLMALQGLEEGAALGALRPALERFRRRVDAILRSLGHVTVAILDWPTVLASEHFQCIHNVLLQYSERYSEFDRALSDIALEYVKRAHRGKVSSESQHQLLRSYVLEELAVFHYLYLSGYHLEVYPGADLGIMRAIAAGDFPDFPIACRDRSHIGIRLIKA